MGNGQAAAHWHTPPVSTGAVKALRDRLGVSPLTARLLVRRGITAPDEAREFLHPRLRHLHDPFRLEGMAATVDRLQEALHANESILLFGDYDVDGLTSTAILTGLLRRLGLAVETFVPRRFGEGYGLNQQALERAFERSTPQLVVAVDCGTHCADVRPWLATQGIDLVVIDHHTARDEIPPMEAFVNPNVRGGEGREFSAAGLAFKVTHALVKQLRQDGNEIAEKITLRDDLDLVALGTVADIVPLRGENRTLVRAGLKMLGRRLRPGLAALMEVAGVDAGVTPGTEELNFRLGPRLNASGRLAEADLPLELLLTVDAQRARVVAAELDGLNRERQRVEAEIFAAAVAQAEGQQFTGAGLVFHDPGWHTGVVGIVASRLVGHFGVPCVVLGEDGDPGVAKGSGRSIPGVSLIEALGACAEKLTTWGGHPMAAGVALRDTDVGAFREAFAAAVATHAQTQPSTTDREIDAWLEPRELTPAVHHDVEALQPFGEGNPAPLLGLRRITLRDEPEVFAEKHVRFKLTGGPGQSWQTVFWGGATNPPPAGTPLDLAVRCTWNAWRGRRTPRFELLAWRPHTGR